MKTVNRIITLVLSALIGACLVWNIAEAKAKGISKPGLASGDSISPVWCPGDSIDKGLLAPVRNCEIELAVHDVGDSRADKAFLAKNLEGKEARYVYSKADMASWVKNHLDTCLANSCPKIARENKYLLGVKIDRFDITESNMYRCSLDVEITIKDADSTVLAKQKISADADSWGRSFSEHSYSLALSNSIVQLGNTILSFDLFKKYRKTEEPQKQAH